MHLFLELLFGIKGNNSLHDADYETSRIATVHVPLQN